MRTLSSIEDLNFAAAMPAPVVVQKASDHALLEETLAGDEDAFAELVRRYRNQITSYIYRMTNDYDGAINTQESFLGQINRAVVIVRHPIDVTGDLISIPRDQLGERVFVARQRPFQQCVVGSLLGD